jgi:hypothetical protein
MRWLGEIKKNRQSEILSSKSFFKRRKMSERKPKKKGNIKLFGGARKNVLERRK